MKIKKVESAALLVFTSMIWGAAFVAQSVGTEFVGPFTFNTVRSILGGLSLIPCIIFFDWRAGRAISFWGTYNKYERRSLIRGGVLCGIALSAASGLQQIGIGYTSVGKAGFLTALYIVIVPVFGVFLKKAVTPILWISIAIAVGGMYFLCINENLTINVGDLLIFLSAVLFSFHILIIDHYAPKVDGIRMSCLQFFVCAIVSAIPMLFAESPQPSVILSAWLPIAYTGVLSSGVGYTIQIIAQKKTHPVIASLILSLESVFAALAGWLILKQTLSLREMIGCLLVLAAIVLAQLSTPSEEHRVAEETE